MRKRRPIIAAFALAAILAGCSNGLPGLNTQPGAFGQTDDPKESEAITPEQQPEGTTMTAIQIIVGETTFSAELYANKAAQTLAEMLPLTLDMSELNGNEKYYYLGEALPRESSIPSEIRAGDLMLYGSDCLVLFYKGFSTTYSYTPLGRIGDPEGLAAALGDGDIQVTFQS